MGRDEFGGKVCDICGRRIKTGWKYCYEHRNSRPIKIETLPQESPPREYNPFLLVALATAIVFAVVVFIAILAIFILKGILVLVIAIPIIAFILLNKARNRAMKRHAQETKNEQ